LSQLTAVTFDLWQTLLLDNRELGRARAQVRLEGAQQALRKVGQGYELEHLREAYRACYRQCRQIREQNLDVSFREQVEIFINHVNPGLALRLAEGTIQEIVVAYADAFFVHPPVPHTEAVAVLQGVKAMGLRVGLISNTGMTPGTTFRQYLAQQRMLEYFDALTFSDEVKLAKPGREIFLLTLQALDASPAQTVHVGDHVQNDVVGAKGCGLKTVWIAGPDGKDESGHPEHQPDARVAGLGQVVPAIQRLGGVGPPPRPA